MFRPACGSPPARRSPAPFDSRGSDELPLLDPVRLGDIELSNRVLVPGDSTATYYVSVRVTIRPVAVEDLGEIEKWLAGESPGAEAGQRGIPGYLLGLAVNISGLGDRTAVGKSERFVPEFLGAAKPPPG